MTPALKKLTISAFITCCILLTAQFYLQFIRGFEPCPLCIMQRTLMVMLGAIYFTTSLHTVNQLGARVYAGSAFLIALGGAGSAARQVWLHHFPPPPDATCAPSLNYMLNFSPPSEVLKTLIKGNGECAHEAWTFLHISIPEWSLLFFLIFTVFNLFLFVQARDLPQVSRSST